VEATGTASHRDKHPLPREFADIAGLIRQAPQILRAAFDAHPLVAPLSRLVNATPPSSAFVERVFSASGRVCAPPRGALSARRVEQLTLIQQYVKRRVAAVAKHATPTVAIVLDELFDLLVASKQ
jgi:hypothetical protein